VTPLSPRPASLLFELPGKQLSATPKPVDPESFVDLGVLEVQHIEKWLAAVPEVLGEELLVVTTQFAGFDKTKERSDILALDRAGRLVVIELKRDTSGSRQDLQALRYAAYCATLSLDDLVDLYARHHSTGTKKVTVEDARAKFEEHVTEGALDTIDEDTRPRIMLVAKSFQVEVTATVLWLRESWGMDVSCIELVPYTLGDKLLLTSSVRIPLPEAAEYTIKRDQKRQKAQTAPKVDWAKAMNEGHGRHPTRSLDELRRPRCRCRRDRASGARRRQLPRRHRRPSAELRAPGAARDREGCRRVEGRPRRPRRGARAAGVRGPGLHQRQGRQEPALEAAGRLRRLRAAGRAPSGIHVWNSRRFQGQQSTATSSRLP